MKITVNHNGSYIEFNFDYDNSQLVDSELTSKPKAKPKVKTKTKSKIKHKIGFI